MALFVLDHSASAQEAKDRAEKLSAELEALFTPEQIDLARSRARSMTLDVIAQQLMSQ
jgi:hypothetical protein